MVLQVHIDFCTYNFIFQRLKLNFYCRHSSLPTEGHWACWVNPSKLCDPAAEEEDTMGLRVLNKHFFQKALWSAGQSSKANHSEAGVWVNGAPDENCHRTKNNILSCQSEWDGHHKDCHWDQHGQITQKHDLLCKKPPKYADESKEEGDDRHVEGGGHQPPGHWQAPRASVWCRVLSFKERKIGLTWIGSWTHVRSSSSIQRWWEHQRFRDPPHIGMGSGPPAGCTPHLPGAG